MTVDDKVTEKEKIIREQLELIRTNLNNQRLIFNDNKNDWKYIASLGHTQIKLAEILDFIKS